MFSNIQGIYSDNCSNGCLKTGTPKKRELAVRKSKGISVLLKALKTTRLMFGVNGTAPQTTVSFLVCHSSQETDAMVQQLQYSAV